jgi:hypothetical protein
MNMDAAHKNRRRADLAISEQFYEYCQASVTMLFGIQTRHGAVSAVHMRASGLAHGPHLSSAIWATVAVGDAEGRRDGCVRAELGTARAVEVNGVLVDAG